MPDSIKQCILVKEGNRCTNTNTSYYYGLTVPIIDSTNPSFVVYICGQCIDDLHYVAHEPERKHMQGLVP